jgi:hypothetical protein
VSKSEVKSVSLTELITGFADEYEKEPEKLPKMGR